MSPISDRTVVYRIQADVKSAQANVAAFGASVRKAADDATAATKEGGKWRSGLESLGNTAGKVGLVAAAGLGAAVKKAADFDQAMSNIAAATHETTGNMEQLRASALKAGADTAFSATEAASGIEELAKAGVATADILGGGLAGALDLAAAGGLGVAEASETAATALTQFKLEGADVPHVADLLSAAAGKAQGSVSDMGMALKQAGLVAAQTGLTIEETTGTLAAFASAGLIGSDAGTSFKTFLQSLTPASDKARDAMEAMGFSAYDAQGNFKGMTTVAGDLRAGLSTMSKEQQNATLKTIFGSDAVRAAAVIYEQGAEGIGGWIDKTNDAGYAAETAATKLDNLKGDLEALGGSLETALIGTGSGAQGPLRSLTQGLTSAVNAYNDLGQGAKSGVAVTLGATALLGGGLFVFSKMVQSVAATRLAMDQLGISAVSTTKLMKGVGATAGVVVGLLAVTAAAEKLRSAFDETLPGANELAGDLLDLSGGKIEGLGGEFDSLGDSVERLTDKRWDVGLSDSIGGLVGVESGGLHDATREIDALDAALANLASSGGTEVATKAFEELAAAQGLSASEQKALRSLLPGYTDALAANENQAALAADSTDELATETGGLADVASVAEREVENLKNTLDGLNGILDQRGNVRAYQASIDDLVASLKENGKTFDITTEKGRNNQAALDGIASSALAVAGGLDTAARKKFLTNAIQDLRTMGESMGLPKAEINRLIGLLEKANKVKVKPEIDVDTVGAMSAIERIRNAMLAIKDKSVTIRVTQTGAGVSPGFGPVGSANGGSVPKDGGPYADRFLYKLAPGEEIISNRHGQADAFRADRAAGRIPGYADGGTTGDDPKRKRRTRAFSVADTTDGLQAALDRLTRVSDDQTAALEATRSALENTASAVEFWGDKMSDVAQSTVSGFNTDLFAKDSNPWAAGAGGGPLANLTKDIAGLTTRASLQSQLAGQGISGDALAALLSGSNADLQGVLARGEGTQIAALYNQAAALRGSVGMGAAQAAYGAQYSVAQQAQQQATAAVTQQLSEVRAATAATERMEARINTMAVQIEQLNTNGPERSGAAAATGFTSSGNKAARRRRRDR